MDGAGDVFAVVAAAATIDPEVVELADTTEQRRRAGARSVIDSLRSVGKLRHGLIRERAIDVLWLLNSPAVFAHLVRRAGWNLDQYQAWLADAMVNELLDHDQQHGSPPPPPQKPTTRRPG
jgi:hypothetical protein